MSKLQQRRGVFSSWLVFVAIPSIAFAQQDGIEEELELLEEEEQVYSAARHQQDISDSSTAITVISREQIENSYCASVACLLQQVPEMDVAPLKPMHTAVSARALVHNTGDQVLVLIDGSEANLDMIGTPVWEALPVHLRDIERIEIVRGPNSALYGANAFSAIVSITTRKTTASGGTVFVAGGERGLIDLYGRAEQMAGNWGLHVSTSHEASNSWEVQGVEERRVSRILARANRNTLQSTSELELDFSSIEGLLFTTIMPFEFNNGRLAHALASQKSEHWEERLSFTYSSGEVNFKAPLFYLGLKLGELPPKFNFQNTALDAEVQTSWSFFGDNLLIAGASYRWTSTWSPNNNPERFNQHRIGLFLHDEQRFWEKLLVTGGLRFDYNNVTPFNFSPQIAAVLRLGQHHLRLSFGQAFRKPNILNTSVHIKGVKGINGIEEFFERGFGNENLNNEKVTTLELGYRGLFFGNRFTLESDVYYNQFRDSISFTYLIKTNSLGFPDLQNSYFGFSNSELDANSLGGTLSATYHLQEVVRISANYSFRYSYYLSNPSDVPWLKKGDQLLWVPAHYFNFNCSYTPSLGLRAGIGLHVESRKEALTTVNGSMFGEYVRVRLPALFFASAFASWRFRYSERFLEAGVRATNVFNMGFYGDAPIVQADGKQVGGERVGRQIMIFVNASL